MSDKKCNSDMNNDSSSMTEGEEVHIFNDALPKPSSVNSAEQLPPKKVCFICGSYTSQTINIYEPRAGPNIIDVINAKFKVPPLNDDKYLCYSCNNWLINWHSVQYKNQAASSSSPPSSSAAGCKNENHKSTSNRAKYNQISTPLLYRSNTSNDHHTSERDAKNMRTITELSVASRPVQWPIFNICVTTNTDDTEYFGGCLQTLELRAKLARYLYRPKMNITTTTTCTEPDSVVSVIKINNRDTSRIASRVQKIRRPRVVVAVPIDCNMCGKPLVLRLRRLPVSRRHHTTSNALHLSRRCVRFCRNCRREMHQYYFGEFVERAPISSRDENPKHHVMIVKPLQTIKAEETTTAGWFSSMPTDDRLVESKSKLVDTYVLSRLEKLGTTVVREEDEQVMSEDITIPTAYESISSTISHLKSSSPLLFSSLSYSSSYARNKSQQQMNIKPYVSIDEIQSWPSERNDKNEIVLAFDQTLTEVFPSSSGRVTIAPDQSSSVTTTTTDVSMIHEDSGFPIKNDVEFDLTEYDRISIFRKTEKHFENEDETMVDDIYSRIPKSLSITLLST